MKHSCWCWLRPWSRYSNHSILQKGKYKEPQPKLEVRFREHLLTLEHFLSPDERIFLDSLIQTIMQEVPHINMFELPPGFWILPVDISYLCLQMGEMNNSGFPLPWRLFLLGLSTSYTMHPEFWKLFNRVVWHHGLVSTCFGLHTGNSREPHADSLTNNRDCKTI